MRAVWVLAVLLGVVAVAAPAPSPIRFEDDAAPARTDPRQGISQGEYRDSGHPAPQTYDAVAEVPPADGEGRLRHKKKKKKKKVICGLANLIAGRDAGSVDPSLQHRAARAVPQDPGQGPQGPQGLQGPPGDGRSYGGVGVAGFLLGTLVGSKLGYGFGAQHQGPVGPVGPVGPIVPAGPTQTQVQTQVQQVAVPAVPVAPAPVHEDYDDVEDDFMEYQGPGSLCDQLQQRPDPGPLDSHFPLLSGILAGGGQQQRPLYRPPPPRPPPQHYGFYKPQHSLLYSYIKPWTDLLFK